MATEQYLSVFKGDSKTYTLNFVDGDGNAIDISGDTVYLTLKDDATDTTNVLQKIVTSHTDASNGETQISLSTTDTDQTVGSYDYDIRLERSDGSTYVVLYGRFKIEQAVTSL